MTVGVRPRVLLVEDDAVVVETLVTYLGHAGFEVTPTGDGHDGLSRAASGNFALVILDWMVPGLPGPEICTGPRTGRLIGAARRAATDRGAARPEW
jgi:two-component system OmpR family response regulator